MSAEYGGCPDRRFFLDQQRFSVADAVISEPEGLCLVFFRRRILCRFFLRFCMIFRGCIRFFRIRWSLRKNRLLRRIFIAVCGGILRQPASQFPCAVAQHAVNVFRGCVRAGQRLCVRRDGDCLKAFRPMLMQQNLRQVAAQRSVFAEACFCMCMQDDLRLFTDQDRLGGCRFVQAADEYICPDIAVVRVLVFLRFFFPADQIALLPFITVFTVRMCFRHCMARFRMCVRLDFHKCADECAGIVVAGLIMQMDDAGGIVGVFLCKCAVKRLLQAKSDLCIAACVMPVCSGCHGDGGVDQRIAGCTCNKDCKADQSQTVPLPVFVRLAIALCFERGKQFHAWEPPADESMRESQREYGKVRGIQLHYIQRGFTFQASDLKMGK